MQVFISGGGGFLGARLANELLTRGVLDGSDRVAQSISGITCFDAAFPRPMDPRIRCVTGDIAAPGVIAAAMPADTAWVFNFAA
ncbi:MAG: NAD-dependent epimerase, partial [Burkholderiales bacterium]